MKYTQGEKFSQETQLAKRNIRLLRILAGNSVSVGAKLLDLSRKQMEDIETTRNYGCYLSLDLLVSVCEKYDATLEWLITDHR